MTQYKTESLVLASYLFGLGFELLDLIKNDKKNNMYFVFRFSEQLPTAVNLYITHGASMNPDIYHEAEKELKKLLYMARNNINTNDEPRI